MMQDVALLRGINVGGNSMVKMEELRKVFEELGFKNVKTLLNSGNVIFESTEENLSTLSTKIIQKLDQKFSWEIGVIIRTKDEFQKLINSDPFKNVKVTSETKLYVTFLSEKPKTKMKTPFEPSEDFKIHSVTDGEVCCVVKINAVKGTTNFMKFMEKEFGKKVTTRNWNTVLKIANLLT